MFPLHCESTFLSVGKMASSTHVIQNQRDLHIELEPVTAQWKSFAEQLGLPDYIIRTIAASGGSNPEECITEVLTRWAQQMAQSWRILIDAIDSTKTNVNLAEQLREKYRSELRGSIVSPSLYMPPPLPQC